MKVIKFIRIKRSPRTVKRLNFFFFSFSVDSPRAQQHASLTFLQRFPGISLVLKWVKIFQKKKEMMALLPYQAELTMDVLGTGGFGVVYRGNYNHTPVAVKRLKFALSEMDEDLRRDFQAEVEMLSKLRHPHIVTLIGISV